MIACVVAVVFHILPVLAEDVSVTSPPIQKEVGPLALIVGAGGIELTVTVTGADAGLVQPSSVCVTV